MDLAGRDARDPRQEHVPLAGQGQPHVVPDGGGAVAPGMHAKGENEQLLVEA